METETGLITFLEKYLKNQGFPDGAYSCLGLKLILVEKKLWTTTYVVAISS